MWGIHTSTHVQMLHTKGLASADHTTLLLNCYTKLKDVEKLDAFIHGTASSSRATAATIATAAGGLLGGRGGKAPGGIGGGVEGGTDDALGSKGVEVLDAFIRGSMEPHRAQAPGEAAARTARGGRVSGGGASHASDAPARASLENTAATKGGRRGKAAAATAAPEGEEKSAEGGQQQQQHSWRVEPAALQFDAETAVKVREAFCPPFAPFLSRAAPPRPLTRPAGAAGCGVPQPCSVGGRHCWSG